MAYALSCIQHLAIYIPTGGGGDFHACVSYFSSQEATQEGEVDFYNSPLQQEWQQLC